MNVICTPNRPGRIGESSFIISGSTPTGRTGVNLGWFSHLVLIFASTPVSGTWSTDSQPTLLSCYLLKQRNILLQRLVAACVWHSWNSCKQLVVKRLEQKKRFHYCISRITSVIPWLFLQHHHETDICGFEWNVLITVGWMALKLGSDMNAPLRWMLITLVIPELSVATNEWQIWISYYLVCDWET